MTRKATACRGLFVTGTDTGVGKTYMTALVVRELIERGLNVGAYKPVCTGCVERSPSGVDQDVRSRHAEPNVQTNPSADSSRPPGPVWPDVERLWQATGGRYDRDRICPQRWRAALAPPVAARLEGARVDAELLRRGAEWWRQQVDFLVVEGVGGLLCPLTETECVADLAADIGFPLVIVARLGLGTINHTLLTLEAAQHRGLPVAGIVLNQCEPSEQGLAAETNPAEIAARTDAAVLGVCKLGQSGGLLREGRLITMDWTELAGV